MTMKWWGYRHMDGTIHAKRYFSDDDLDEAYESPFVMEVFDPIEVQSGQEAFYKFITTATKKEGLKNENN